MIDESVANGRGTFFDTSCGIEQVVLAGGTRGRIRILTGWSRRGANDEDEDGEKEVMRNGEVARRWTTERRNKTI